MKYKSIYWIMLKPLINKYLKKHYDKKTKRLIFRNAKAEYKRLLNKADDIGSNNPMSSNIYFSLLFVSFLTGNREIFTKKTLEEMMESIFSIFNSPLVKKLNRIDLNKESDMNKFKNRILRNSAWADKHRDKHPETWEFNFEDKHKDGCYYYFTKCPIAKFFKDNNMEDLTHLFCDLDYKTFAAVKGRLIRNCTLANGDDMCDFWVVGDKLNCPQ
ncbi:MAG: L-2-amino-thiazoline-4-carboxylic acid hydrolase [Christensenellaceae bacterium]|nr:L-2-amino-thiazoline-4-carboxylic acid hydrolase [Christensenellaceae bacterium]